jgi:hypothetical protein
MSDKQTHGPSNESGGVLHFPVKYMCIPGHLSQAKWISPKHDKIGSM